MSRMEGIQASICEQSTEPGENEALKQTAYARRPNHKLTEDANTEGYRPAGIAVTTVTESKDSNIAAEVHGGMGNKNYHISYNYYVSDVGDVSDIMTQIYGKLSCNTNNVATAKVAERDSSTLSEDETDSAHCSTINKPQRSQEHSLLQNDQPELEETKESTLSSKCLKSEPSDKTPKEDVSLKSSVKQCQTDLDDHQCTCTQRTKCQLIEKLLTGDVNLHSDCASTRRNSFCFNVRDRAESVDLRAMDLGIQEELSPIEIRLASGEKRNASKHDFDDHKRRDSKNVSIFSFENITDSGVKAVTEANVMKMVKLAEKYPGKVKEISSFLDSKLVPSDETDIGRQCCNVMICFTLVMLVMVFI